MDYPNELQLHRGLLDELKNGFTKEAGKSIEEITEGEFSKKSESIRIKAGVLSNFKFTEEIQPASLFRRFKRALNPKEKETPSIETYDFICFALLGKGISDCVVLYSDTEFVRTIYSKGYSKKKRNRPAKVIEPKQQESAKKKALRAKNTEFQWRKFFDNVKRKEKRMTYSQLKKLMTIVGYATELETDTHIVFSYPGRSRLVFQNGKKDAPISHIVLAKVMRDIISNKIPEEVIERINKEL
jgi:hypothetical protein